MVNASDGKHSASTRVIVMVLDANDNAPEFTNTSYLVESVVVEEDRSVLLKPQRLLTVSCCTFCMFCQVLWFVSHGYVSFIHNGREGLSTHSCA